MFFKLEKKNKKGKHMENQKAFLIFVYIV